MKHLIAFALVFTLSSTFRYNLNGNESKNFSFGLTVEEPGGRILNGKVAKFGQFPYQAGLLLERETGKANWCGGSLISNTWVLTAAHCTRRAAKITVYLGSVVKMLAEVKYDVTKENFFSHPHFKFEIKQNDIALIKIPFTVYSRNIQPIELPSLSATSFLYIGEKAVASGWGGVLGNIPGSVRDLHWGFMEIISNTECIMKYGRIITLSHICTSSSRYLSAPGDSGGPLVSKSRRVQVGVSSCVACSPDYPSVFTRVSTNLLWIKSITGVSY